MPKKKINKVLSILGIILIIFGSLILIYSIFIVDTVNFIDNKNIVRNLEKNNIENNKINVSKVNNKTVDYKAILSIPKIDLVGKIYDINSKLNNVNKNIQVISPSTFPDVENSNLILASHSGNSKISYFKNLDKLILDDDVYLYYQDKKYEYKVKDIYNQEKDGEIEIIKNKNTDTLSLITCDKNDKRYQIVFICELVETSN